MKRSEVIEKIKSIFSTKNNKFIYQALASLEDSNGFAALAGEPGLVH